MRRGRIARDVPPPLELECLRTLWDLGEANVQGVRDALAPVRPLAYTTVMTMLERLTRKRMLARRKVGRSFVYSPLLSRDEARRRALDDLIDSLFAGRAGDLLNFLQAKPAAGTPADDTAPEERLDASLL